MWRKLTEDDLTSRLSRAEIEAYSRSASFATNPVSSILSDVTEEVRGYIASGRKCRMGPDGTIPSMLVSSALSLAVIYLLGRIGISPNEARSKAATDAYAVLNKVSSGGIIPEDYGEPPKESNKLATAPSYSNVHPTRLLD